VTSSDEDYWADYSNLQEVKHKLIRRYLGGWFPKLGSWSRRVLYVDTHAGRGRHLSGELGSPLVALKTLLDHHYRGELLRRSEFEFHFIEKDENNFIALQAELRALGALPRNVRVLAYRADAFSHLSNLLADLQANPAPAFVFVDPYGFKIRGALLRELLKLRGMELFVNVIWRELGMALSQDHMAAGMASTLNDVFDGPEWETELRSGDFDERANRAVTLLARKLGARWATSIRMLGDNRATRYLLAHFSNHSEGRDLMKEAMWNACPDGGFYAWKGVDPTQQFLISPAPDLRPLREWVLTHLRAGPKRWEELIELARPTI
jgi:three-Cys-motif partner protein